ncbi:hypothetical protein [Shimia thalassica]|uniref:hypothetical protein n=1 Tax=Shimia thalassica TaxID=1715693 RepID=UPI0027361042|nr:hypothetical protein [Shimia thalassica]MDP2518731.1 hypothetical protein [Shimia thalassica]
MGDLHRRIGLKDGLPERMLAEAVNLSDRYVAAYGKGHADAFVWDCVVVLNLLQEGRHKRAKMHLDVVRNRVVMRSYETVHAVENQKVCDPRPKITELHPTEHSRRHHDSYVAWQGKGAAADLFRNIVAISDTLNEGDVYDAQCAAVQVVREIEAQV